MSQIDLQSLLFSALASGSEFDTHDHGEPDAVMAARSDEAALESMNMTPAEIIAHYDFRVRSAAPAY